MYQNLAITHLEAIQRSYSKESLINMVNLTIKTRIAQPEEMDAVRWMVIYRRAHQTLTVEVLADCAFDSGSKTSALVETQCQLTQDSCRKQAAVEKLSEASERVIRGL